MVAIHEFQSVSITIESNKLRRRAHVNPHQSIIPIFLLGAIQLVLATFPCELPTNHASLVVSHLLLMVWHLFVFCCYSCKTPLSACCSSDYFSLVVFTVCVPFLFLYGESKAAVAYRHFAGPPVSPVEYSPFPGNSSLTVISKSSHKSAQRR